MSDPLLKEGEGEECLRQIVESLRDTVLCITNWSATELIYISPAYEEIWGRTRQSLFEQFPKWIEAIHPDDRSLVLAATKAATSSGECNIEYRIVRPDSSVRWIRGRTFPVLDPGGNFIRLAAIAEDITEWKRVESELRTSEEHNRLISELTADYAYTARIDPNGEVIIETTTTGFSRVTGYTLAELSDHSGWQSLIHTSDLSAALDDYEKRGQENRNEGELRIVTKGGAIRWIRYSSQPYCSGAAGRHDRLVGAVQDITERKEAEIRLRELSRRLLNVQEQERRHLARELHDEIGQYLTALSLNLEAMANAGASETASGLKRAQDLVRDLSSQVRDLSLRLRPTMLDDLGLLPALLWLVDPAATRTRLRINFEHSGLGRRLGTSVETAAYRIVQEALTNVARHAGVEEATVRAWLEEGILHLAIQDQGRGFRVDDHSGRRCSAGLSGMKERAALLHGHLNVESSPGSGTRVTAALPLSFDQ